MRRLDGIINGFDQFGILPHSVPNAIGMWPEEQEYLAYESLQTDEGSFLEIGSFCGGSAVLLGMSLLHLGRYNEKVYSIDVSFNRFFEFNIKRANLEELSVALQINSSELMNYYLGMRPISLALIDGFHSYKQILVDFEQVKPLLSNKAIVMFHDVSPLIYDENYRKSCLNFTSDSDYEDFRVDEAICRILANNPDFQLKENPLLECKHFKETGLTEWVRGKTSPFNALCAIEKRK
jgi:predicted O-methyltransferase YrrM